MITTQPLMKMGTTLNQALPRKIILPLLDGYVVMIAMPESGKTKQNYMIAS